MPIYPPEEINSLANINGHPRDEHIEFDPVPHTYTIYKDPSIKYISVTTWNHSHFPHFDADDIITKMFKSKKWGPEHKYWGQTREEIKAGWDKNCAEASGAGTDMHYRIECFNNMPPAGQTYKELLQLYETTYGQEDPTNNLSTEWQYFLNYVRDHPDFKPYRTEWMVFHEELQLSGSIDMIYELPNGDLLIYDWKRAKEIKQDDSFNKCAITPCISDLPDTNYWHYTLQLNIYKMILEQKYNKKVVGLCLVVLHPNNFNENYLLYPVPIIEREIRALQIYRLEQLGKPVPDVLRAPIPTPPAKKSKQAKEDTTYDECLF